jgi:hypothetical protein
MQASLTSLRNSLYGHDTPNGGDSGEPYIITNIPPAEQQQVDSTTTWNSDSGLVRGGFQGATLASSRDFLRINKFLRDAPRGPMFIAKQVGLQLSNPQLETRKGDAATLDNILQGNLGSIFTGGDSTFANVGATRIYNLGINTLAQVPLNAFGGHLVRHGLVPVFADSQKYEAVVIANNQAEEGQNNKLVLLKKKLDGNVDTKITSYVSGPGSVDGIGITTIQRYNFTLANKQLIPLVDPIKIDQQGNVISNIDINGFLQWQRPNHSINYYNTQGVSLQYLDNDSNEIEIINNIKADGTLAAKNQIDQNAINYGSVKNYLALKNVIDDQIFDNRLGKVNVNKYNKNQQAEGTINVAQDVNQPITFNVTGKSKYKNLDLSQFNIDNRLGLAQSEGYGSHDDVNLTPLYYADNAPGSAYIDVGTGRPTKVRDLIKFRIEAVDNDSPNNSVWMIFRAYLKNITDNPNPTWNSINYMGRGESFFIYKGFERTVSFTLQVAAMSEDELRPIYQKLNFLYSNTMPDYGDDNVMRAPYMKLTLGDYMFRQPGIIKSMTYTIDDNSPWEIAIDEPENGGILYELPHVMTIQMTFAVIHDFLPRKFPKKYDGKSWSELPAFVADRQTINNKGTPGNPWLTDIYGKDNRIPIGKNSEGIPAIVPLQPVEVVPSSPQPIIATLPNLNGL